MRYKLTDHEWMAIRPMLPNQPCGVVRVNHLGQHPAEVQSRRADLLQPIPIPCLKFG